MACRGATCSHADGEGEVCLTLCTTADTRKEIWRMDRSTRTPHAGKPACRISSLRACIACCRMFWYLCQGLHSCNTCHPQQTRQKVSAQCIERVQELFAPVMVYSVFCAGGSCWVSQALLSHESTGVCQGSCQYIGTTFVICTMIAAVDSVNCHWCLHQVWWRQHAHPLAHCSPPLHLQ